MSDVVKPGCTSLDNVTLCSNGGAYERGTEACPECGNENARSLTEWPNFYVYLPGIVLCECGDAWWPEEGRAPRPFKRGWRQEAQRRFERLWGAAAPEGSRFTYSDDGYLVVTTPDGTRHSAWDGEQDQQQ